MKSKQGSITAVIWVSVSGGSRGRKGAQDVKRRMSTRQAKARQKKIRHTEMSTLDARVLRDTSDTDHRAEVGDSCKRVEKKYGKKV